MRLPLAALLIVATSPALAQFPPPGVYACTDADGAALGALSLLVAGDYGWQPLSGPAQQGQIASSGSDVEALTGPLADAHWRGSFLTEAGLTRFGFDTDAGKVICEQK